MEINLYKFTLIVSELRIVSFSDNVYIDYSASQPALQESIARDTHENGLSNLVGIQIQPMQLYSNKIFAHKQF